MTATKSTRTRQTTTTTTLFDRDVYAAATATASTSKIKRYLGHDKGLWVRDRIAGDFPEIIRQRRHDLYDRDLDTGRTKRSKRPKGPRMYTQAWLAKRLGVSGSTISSWERGKRLSLLKPGHFWMLGYLLGLSPEEMLEAAGYLAPGSKATTPTTVSSPCGRSCLF